MKHWVILTMLVTAWITTPTMTEARGIDAVEGIVRDVLGLDRTVRGHVVQSREATLVLRGQDARTYTINTAGLDVDGVRRLRDGWPVAVTLKSPGPGAMPIATSVTREAGPAKAFRRVEGVVDDVSDERIVFRTREGQTLVLDRNRIIGEPPRVVAQESGTLFFEEEPRVAGVWIETREIVPSAAPRGGR